MTVMEMDDERFESGTMEVWRDEDDERRIECWTDGHWVRLGCDVRAGACIEFHIEKFDTIESKIRYSSGAEKWGVKSEYGGDEDYITIHEMYRPYVVHDRAVVLVMGDDGFPLYKARGLATEERDDFDAEEIARSYLEAEWPFKEITRCSRVGLTEKVRVSIVDDPGIAVKLRLVDDLREREEVLSRGDDISVSVEESDEDEHTAALRYDFTLLVDKLEGGDA